MLPPTYDALVEAFRLLPGVGARSAERFALHVLKSPPGVSGQLARALREAGEKIRPCLRCGFYTESGDQCAFCRDDARQNGLLCVVEQASDVMRIEKARTFQGRYHVLGGRLSPLDGVGPEQLRLAPLLSRLGPESVTEVVLALGADVEGETTCLYLAPQLKEASVRVSRLATGLPAGGGLEFADSVTLGFALAGRREI